MNRSVLDPPPATQHRPVSGGSNDLAPVSSGRATLRVAHLLRKCNPEEWGGTETAIQRLCEGLRQHEVSSVVYCPRLESGIDEDPLTRAGHSVRRFQASVPIWGISPQRRR